MLYAREPHIPFQAPRRLITVFILIVEDGSRVRKWIDVFPAAMNISAVQLSL